MTKFNSFVQFFGFPSTGSCFKVLPRPAGKTVSDASLETLGGLGALGLGAAVR